ncbi:stemmadenine O-acetyltransferase-like [Diospyros lotus]|uniref:stemmadenine O-acetyltransferase-like n=1 Tax=Diospyros lotus TaxID=55363 RepID=UPI00224CB4B4|nr:stemmadenine O-acetyltransferase-like [Diospyros lotus]
MSEKMKFEVEIISRETIKPSSPTPNHLRHYQLSFLDQISPPVHMPIILFFHSNVAAPSLHHSTHLKLSLSHILTRFYPLAGRLSGNASIVCTDEGVSFVEATTKSPLSEVAENPVPGEYNKLLPHELDDGGETLMSVQVTYFSCGGMAVATCFSHKVADALSMVLFLTNWAAASRGETDLVQPQFDSAKLFPAKDLSGFLPNIGMTKEKMVAKRFVFSNSAVAALRDKYTDGSTRPTRVEALSIFIWNRFLQSTAPESGHDRRFHVVIHAVNLRTRMDPPLPEHSFGNLYRIAVTIPSKEAREQGRGLLREMRESIKSIDSDFVSKLQKGNEHLRFIAEQAQRFMKGKLVPYNFTSLCRMPLYEADFGWGRPVRVGSTRLPFKNLVTFMETGSGDGIEAWINMVEKEMARFEADKEFLAFILPPRSP